MESYHKRKLMGLIEKTAASAHYLRSVIVGEVVIDLHNAGSLSALVTLEGEVNAVAGVDGVTVCGVFGKAYGVIAMSAMEINLEKHNLTPVSCKKDMRPKFSGCVKERRTSLAANDRNYQNKHLKAN